MVTINPNLGVTKQVGYEKRRVNRFNTENMKRFGLNLHLKHDRKMIKWLDNHKPYQATLKRLIREEMAREKEANKKAKSKQNLQQTK